MSTCPRCGAPVPEGARFCPSCGFNLVEAPREERRVVTVVFGDLSGFTEMSERLDAEEVKAIVDRAFEGLAELVTLYGGRVDKIIGDEIMAVFGAPQAHEDDSERAVRCGLEMQRQLVRFSHELERDRGVRLRMRIGVNTGEVVAGVAGGGDAYTVLGDAVNTASRIEHAAEPGQILVGESTYLATHEAIEYREHLAVVAKGKQEPLQVWEAIVERALPGTPGRRTAAPLVGRDEELATLEALADIVRRDRRPTVVTVVGDAGMGKSRLAVELARRLEVREARVLAGRSLPYGTTSPSFAVEEICRSALDVDLQTHPEVARARVQERLERLGLAAEAERLLGLLGLREREAAALPAGGRAGPSAGAAQAPRGGEALQSAARLLETLAAQEGLLVLVFHELHWAEDPLLEFVGGLAERGRNVPLLVLCLARPEVLERRPPWIGRPGTAVLSLEPLPRDRAAALLDALLGAEAIHPSVRDNVLERAGGNPFYLEELFRLLLDQKALGPQRSGTVAVPGTVHAVVAARLDALPAEAKRMAQASAVVGDRFWAGTLERLEPGLGPPEIQKLLDALADRELVEPVESSAIPGQREYRFRQAIAREVAYAGLPKQARARAHAAVGGWLEDVTCACGMERDFFDLVAHHYERASVLAREVGIEVEGAAAKAREYLEQAGDQALAQDAAPAACDFYERALPFATGEEDRLHLRLHLGEALVGAFRLAESEPHLREALEGARRLGQRGAEGKALRLLGDMLRMRDDVDEAQPYLDQALEIAREVGDRYEEAQAIRSRGLADLFRGRLSSASQWFHQALALSREIGDRRSEGWSLQNLAWANLILGRLDEALASLEEGGALFGELGDVEGVGWCLGLRAWALLFQGRLADADELAGQIEAMIESAPARAPGGTAMSHFGWAIGRVLRAIVALARGRFAVTDELAGSAIPVFEELESAWGLAMGRVPLAWAALDRRRIAEAGAILEEAAGAARESGDPLPRALVGFLSARTAFAAGDLDRAERLREESWALTEATGTEWFQQVSTRWLRAEILRARGRDGEARALLEETAAFSQAGLFPASYALASLADLMCDQGEPEGAAEVARRAVEGAGDHVIARAAALCALARALRESGRLGEAEAAAREDLELLEPTDYDEARIYALAQLAMILGAAGRTGEAAEALERARSILARFPPGAAVAPLEAAISGASA